MADAAYIDIGASPTAAHWNALYAEAENRLGYHYNELSPFLWDGFDSDWRFLARRRYYVFGSTPLKKLGVDELDNLAEWVLAAAYAGAFLPTSEDNDFFRDYDMTPFDTVETACFLRNTPRPDDARPRTSSLGPTALVSLDSFDDTFTGSVWPISGSQARPIEYVRSFYYSPKAHRKYFTFGPEYSSSQYYCYLTVDGAVNATDVPPADEQPGTEHVSAFTPAEWLIFEVGGTWTFPTYETKERFHRIHNFDNQVLVVTVSGGTWSIPPGGCLAFRRNTLTEFAKASRGGDGVHSGYFWRFQTADPRILHPTQIVGPPLVAGSALDQNGNNLTDPLMLNAVMYYLLGGWWGDPDMAVYDVSRAEDTSAIYNYAFYATHSRAAEIAMPVGGWYASLSDETKPVGDYVIHKGKLMFASVNHYRSLHSQSFSVSPSDTFNLFRTEDGRVARNVADIQMFSASISIPQFGPSYNWTSSTNITGTGSVFFTSSVWTTGQTVLSTWTSEDPDGWHTENYSGFNSLNDVLNRNSMSLVDASGTTFIAGTYYISSPLRDIQIIQLSTNLCSYLFGALAVDPYGNPSGSIINYIDCYAFPTVPFITAVTQSDERIEWLVSSDGPSGGWGNPVTTSNQLQNLWRAYSSDTSPNTSASVFTPVSTVLNAIRNYGGADNECTINADLMMTPFGPQIITNATIPVDWPLINGRYQDASWDGNPNFWLPSNYDSHSNASWYFTRGQALGYYGGNLLDPGTAWASPGNFRGGEICTPRIKRAYGVERSFTHDPTQSNFVISGTTAPYDTTENARLKSYWENQPFLNYDSPNNNWTGSIASGSTYDLDDIAFVGTFGTSATRLACLQAWKSKGTASYNGGYLDFGPGTGRETTYYPNEKSHLLDNTNTTDDDTIKPQVLHLTAEHFNIAASSVNHSAGTKIFGDYQPSAASIFEALFPAGAIGGGFTQFNRQYSPDSLINIRPRTCFAMWSRAANGSVSGSLFDKFGVTVKTTADFPDQTKFAAVTAPHVVTKWALIDGSGNFVITDYSDYPTNTNSQSLWLEAGGVWSSLYPTGTGSLYPGPDDLQWIDFTQAQDIADQMGIPFHYQDLAVPLAFDYVQTPTATNLNNDNSGWFGGGSIYACSAFGWYNDANGDWVATGNPVDGIVNPPSGAFDGMWALRADISPINKLQAVYAGLGGNLSSLVEFDYKRLPEKWVSSIGTYMPNIADWPYCTVTTTAFNSDEAWGNQSYLYRHYGPTAGTWRGAALIWPRNFADFQRNYINTVYLHNEWLNFLNYPTLDAWFSIPRNVSNGISGPPRKIDFTQDETIISATDIGYAHMEIITGFKDFSL